jgi:hypothetical protein
MGANPTPAVWLLAGAAIAAFPQFVPAQPSSGPDILYADVTSASTYGPIAGIRAYVFDTATCNMGDTDIAWISDGSPGVGFNLYRLHDGRLIQIGQSWTKVACCAAPMGGCGLPCNGGGGDILGSGCRDVYSSAWNATQVRLMPRSQVNPWTAQFGSIPSFSGNAVDRRLQVAQADLLASSFPGAIYIAEGVYVATGEAGPATKHNNASYRIANINQATFQMTFAGMPPMAQGIPAIQAWHDHGLGPNTPDPSVVVQQVDVPEEGRFWVAHKTADNGDGTWRYEYAVFNLNSHVSGGSFSIPVPEGVSVSNVGFHDVNYHSGEPYDNTDWLVQVGSGSVTWRSPQTFAQNPNTNALRWGTMYNFWFDADAEPTEGQATLGLFRPYTPDSVQFAAAVPSAAGGGGCATDFNGDLVVNSTDISAFLSAWLLSINEGTMDADFNGDLTVNSSDISAFLTVWLEEVNEGC